MGDSITFGQYLDPRLRWTALVEDHLESKLRHGTEIHHFNRGISGETTRMALERFPRDVQEVRPDVMTLQFGLNDCNCWHTDEGLPRVSARAFRANLVEMIDRARNFGAKEIVLSTNHRTLRRETLPNGEVYDDAARRYNEIIRDVAETTAVALCDVEVAFATFSDEELAMMLLPAPDLLHLSAAGNRVYFEAICPYLEEAVTNLIQEPIAR